MSLNVNVSLWTIQNENVVEIENFCDTSCQTLSCYNIPGLAPRICQVTIWYKINY